MKTLLGIILLGMAIGCGYAQTEPAHEWKVTLKVVDDTGQPVAGAEAQVNYLATQFRGFTDTNGIFIASHVDQSVQLAFQVHKSGYYSYQTQYLLGFKYDAAKWNPTVKVILRPVGHPIAMYAKHVGTKTPQEDTPLGFDLMAGDWVAPYGKGKNTDLIFTVHRKVVNVHKYDAELTLTFPNKGDGIAIAPPEPSISSAFTTSRTASENGYEPSRTWHYSDTEQPQAPFGYFLRVRTILDEGGNVKSAYYAKVNGDFHLYVGTKVPRSGIGFEYLLNPTPNDRNVEFDPKQNLLGGLPSYEQVKAP